MHDCDWMVAMLAKDINRMTQQLLNRASLKALLAKPFLQSYYSSLVKLYETFIKAYKSLLKPILSVLVPWLGVPKRSPPSDPDVPQSRMSRESRMSPQSRMSHDKPMPPEPLVTPKSRFRAGKRPKWLPPRGLSPRPSPEWLVTQPLAH